MDKYHKIQTVFKRDPETKFKTLLEGEFSLPEFEFLKDATWVCTEKVDGTNIRAIWDGEKITFKGKTDNAQIPPFLLETLQNEVFDLFTVELIRSIFNDTPVCFYGEGYGAKIQKGGGNYRKDNSFVLFDIKCNNIFFAREKAEDIADSLGIEIVPIVEECNLFEAVEIAREGFQSWWGKFDAEGLVMKPKIELCDRNGNRIITKIKHKDFRDKGEQ